MFENINIKKVKKELRNHSKNYRENFVKIELKVLFISITEMESNL